MHLALSPAVADSPFRLQVTPDQAIDHPGWRRARAAVRAALGRGQMVVLLGAPGTGKTLLLRDLAQALRHEGRSVQLVERGDALDPALTAEIMLVDEADRMSPSVLACLHAAGRPVVLAALPSFAAYVAELTCTITTVMLEPLSPEDIARFVAARLSAAGRSRDLLEPEAILALAEHSAGLLRPVNVLAGAAVFLAELEQAPRVSRRHVDEAVAMRGGDGEVTEVAAQPTPELTSVAARRTDVSLTIPRQRPAWWPNAAGVAVALLGLVLAGSWTLSGRHSRPPPDAPTAGSAARRSGEPVSGQPLQGQTDDRDQRAESAQGRADGPVQSEQAPAPQQDAEVQVPLRASPALHPRPAMPSAPLAFRGPVYNDTLQRGGQMSLVIRRQQPAGTVTARFEAWAGLLGSGELTGQLSEDGRLRASGQLMMGRNAFTCELSGIIVGDQLRGSASFVRVGSTGRTAHSSFTLSRS